MAHVKTMGDANIIDDTDTKATNPVTAAEENAAQKTAETGAEDVDTTSTNTVTMVEEETAHKTT